MANRVYYGEYSLKHWIEMMLRRGIELPEYQRYYTWTDDRIVELVETFNEGGFVPPVTIGLFKQKGKTQNYIIDGQQRLTSVLLAAIGWCPDKELWKKGIVRLAENDVADDGDDESETMPRTIVRDWRYDRLFKQFGDSEVPSITSLSEAIRDSVSKCESQPLYYQLRKLPTDVNDKFLSEHYLGFSYIVPESDDADRARRFYSKEFRKLNTGGVALFPIESRKALYFLKDGYNQVFDPDFTQQVCLISKGQKNVENEKLDFVRYLSLLTQYCTLGHDCNGVAKGYKREMEKYYEDFILSVVDQQTSKIFGDVNTALGAFLDPTQRQCLTETITNSGLLTSYPSIIDMDVTFFGYFYWLIFEGKSCRVEDAFTIQSKVATTCQTFKNDLNHKRTPGAFKYLRQRMQKSIELYMPFFTGNAE